ncbi:MAG TPA: ABC transporter substrate-binding protein [Terriglobales bacterium]|nr:ABC transporter substrate-binding protein [Terriglobales bacterium]
MRQSQQPLSAGLIRALILGTVFVLATHIAQCEQPGVSDKEVKLGSCSALDGPARQLGIQTVVGATAYLNYINAQGGVHGRKVQLLAFDDGYDPEKTTPCFKRLEKEGVFAAGFFVGTPTAAKYVPMAQADKVPVVGLFTGAQILYEPVKHYILNVRASYYDETHEQIENLWDIGVHKVGVIYQDDAFGKAVLDGVELALDKHHSKPVALGTFPRNTLSIDSGLTRVRLAHPEAVILVGPYAPVAEIVKRAHAEGWHPIFVSVSFVGTEAFIKEAGKDAEGTIITQVVPPVDRIDLPTVQLYRQALEKYFPNNQPSFVSLEGFLDAMVVVEGLKRAGQNVTRDKFIEGIESIHNQDIGLGPKLKLNYGPEDHKGLDKVYSTVVRDGKAVVINDWKTATHASGAP